MRRRPGLVIHPIVFLEIKTFIGSTEGHGLVIRPIVFLETITLIGSTEGHGLVIHPIVFLEIKTLIGSTEGHGLVIDPIVFFLNLNSPFKLNLKISIQLLIMFFCVEILFFKSVQSVFFLTGIKKFKFLEKFFVDKVGKFFSQF